MCETQPTEIDRLLPSPVSSRTSYQKNDHSHRRRRRFLIGGAATLAVVLVVFSISSSGGIRRSHYRPKNQRGALQHLTEDALAGVLPSLARTNDDTAHRHPNGKIHVISDKKHKHDGEIYHCTSQVMIMRHCDKEVEQKAHGKVFTTDMRDKRGDGHCSAKGKQRSEYIATLFVDPNHYQKLVKNKEVEDGIPPVPMIKSSLAKVSKSAASKKPQFPTPHKLYALSKKRGKHDNFREIETITPLSDKFHLDMDDRFGVYKEGQLAADFFENLSKSVTDNVNRKLGSPNASDSSSSTEDSNISSLCDNGMTVVNWKHSRIPALARAFGCGKNEGCPTKYQGHDFDTLWLLTFQYSLLVERVDEMNVEASFLALESLSKSAETGSLRHDKKKHSHGDGKWKVTAELVNEGFDPNN